MSSSQTGNMEGLRASTFNIPSDITDNSNTSNSNATYVRSADSFIVEASDSNNEEGDSDDDHPQRPAQSSKVLRVISFDLIEHVFGQSVPITLASLVLLVLLKHDVVQVFSRIDDVPSPSSTAEQIDACIDAVGALQGVLHHKLPHHYGSGTYRWERSPRLETTTRAGATKFLNTLAIIAHRIVTILVASPTMGVRPLRSLWTLPPIPVPENPRANTRMSSTSSNSSDDYYSDYEEPRVCKPYPLPDIAALPIAAFTVSHGLSDPRDDINQHPPVYSTIQSIFSDPPSQTLSDKGSSGMSASSTLDLKKLGITVNELKAFLMSQLPRLSFTAQDFIDFRQNDIKEQYMCVEAFAATGMIVEGMEPSDASKLEVSYMEKQIIAQPYLRYVLGLGVTETKITLYRGDAMGIEECPFPLDTGSGMLEAIRVALGFAIADNKTLGHMPGFEFR